MEYEQKKQVYKPAEKQIVLNEAAVKIAVKIIKQFEGCELNSYPDPASPLSIALSNHGLLRKFIEGKIALPEGFDKLSGMPFTIGYGNTEGVKQGDVCTQERADSDLEAKVRGRMLAVLKVSPKLANQSPERVAACTSLAYNIGTGNYKDSTVAKMINVDNHEGAAAAILLWNKAGNPPKIVDGLDKRRKIEAALYSSVK